jgi:gliding motility-associated-like protein
MKNLLSILFLFICTYLPSLAQTDFTASAENGCDSLTVKFQYSTSLTVDSVKWTFGDNETSKEKSPQHLYSTPGQYDVSLQINNNAPITKTAFIQIGETPVIDFKVQDTLSYQQLTKTFSTVFMGESVTEPPFLYTYSWQFSKDKIANGSHVVHKFDSIGNYKVRLIVADSKGCADTVVKAVDVLQKLNVPNVFTPNDDGLNDLLIINGDGNSTYNIQIFSRTGLKVFEKKAKVLVWDGRMFSGDEVRDGIFYYVITSVDGPAIKQTGFFYIYR